MSKEGVDGEYEECRGGRVKSSGRVWWSGASLQASKRPQRYARGRKGKGSRSSTYLGLGEVLLGSKRSVGNSGHVGLTVAEGAVVGLALGEASEGL